MWTVIFTLLLGYAIGAYRVKIWNWIKAQYNRFAK